MRCVAVFCLVVVGFGWVPAHGSAGGSRVVLVTGFEPFGNYLVNPSGLIAEALNGTVIGNATIVGVVLPVNFTTAVEAVDAAIDVYRPVVVVSVGLNARVHRLAVEHWGVNLMRLPRGSAVVRLRRLVVGGPWVRPVSVPVSECVRSLRGVGVPVRGSWWAGTYVCNAVLYGELGHVAAVGLGAVVGFVHVPLLDSQDPGGLPLAVEVEGIRGVVSCCLGSVAG